MSAVIAEPATTSGRLADVVTFSCVDGPGNRFVVFLQGCNFDCVACHNPHTIAPSSRRLVEVGDLVARIRRAAPFIRGITVSGGEATLQAAFVHDLFASVKADPALAHLSCFVDSNGSTDPDTWTLLDPVMDAAMIDLKCLDPDIHRRLTGSGNAEVLASIERLHAAGKLYEVRLLLVRGWNDDPALLRRTARWLADVDPRMRVKLIGFRGHGVRPHDPPLEALSSDELRRAAAALAAVAPFELSVV